MEYKRIRLLWAIQIGDLSISYGTYTNTETIGRVTVANIGGNTNGMSTINNNGLRQKSSSCGRHVQWSIYIKYYPIRLVTSGKQL